MSGFAALMKLSQSQTAQSELAVQNQIASHQTQLEKKRREQEAKERKERELEARLRAKRFEEQRKEEERKRKRADEEEARRRELEKREEQIRDALKYGPKKASSAGSNSKSKGSDKGDDGRTGDADFDSGSVLTREEKRQRKLDAHLRRAGSTSSRRGTSGSNRTAILLDGRMVRKLPGGAVDVTTTSRLEDPDAVPSVPPELANKSTRARLAAMPSTLVKLNTVKRDTRSIDDYLSERAKTKQNKVLAGEDAKDFSDWFGKSKKQSSTPQLQQSSSSPSRAVSATPSVSPAPTANPFGGPKAKPAPAPLAKTASFLKPINPKPNPPTRTPIVSSSSSAAKKRPRSPSPSPPPPTKRRPSAASRPATSASASISRSSRRDEGELDLRSQIWSLFGKDRKAYTTRDILSDDEDMEADAQSVLKEEARSARLAHKEDEYALAEERRHEEEKRRRKKERERRERA